MEENDTPIWFRMLTEEEQRFLKRFLLTSGSLKALAEECGVSYPTVRARLDKLIAKVKAMDTPSKRDPFDRLLEILVAEGVLLGNTARTLEQAHTMALREAVERERHAEPPFYA